MQQLSILSDEFAEAAAQAGRQARQAALAAGHSVVSIDKAGRFVEERPDGKLFEVWLDPSQPRETHCVVLREITSTEG